MPASRESSPDYELPRPSSSGAQADVVGAAEELRRPLCLVLPAEASRGLPPEFSSNLDASLPEVHTVTEQELASEERPDAVWVMGCPASDFGSVADVRERYPDAFVLVTCRDLSATRAQELERAGADRALNWAGTIAGVRRELHGALV